MPQRVRRIKMSVLALTLGLSAIAAPAYAGPFDCSVVYDEFDSLMNKNYLLQPEAYGPVVQDRLSREQFNTQQKGKLLLRPGREGSGVAIVKTNQNKWGKLLFTWTGRGDSRGTPLLVIHDVTLYARVKEGGGRRQIREIRMTASQTVDLDTGRASTSAEADIRYRNVGGKTLYIEAVNGARLVFPLETLCRQ